MEEVLRSIQTPWVMAYNVILHAVICPSLSACAKDLQGFPVP